MGSRFWWRALDAQSPQPVTSNPPNRMFHRSLHTKRVVSPAHGFTLQVPRSDRRRMKRKVPKASVFALSVAALVAIVGSVGAIALTLSDITLRDAQDSARQYAAQAMIGAGFGIDQISLTGQRYTIDTEVFDALDLANVKTFAALDTAAVLKRIERISWVDTAQITRVFPSTLSIEIKERTPAAIWRRGDKMYLIDATGRTLGPVTQTASWALPHVAGEGASEEAPVLLSALNLHKDIQARFSYAERIAERRWSVVLSNGSRIELGADREIEGLDHVASNSALRKALSGPPVIIDVRTSGRAIVRFAATSAALTAPAAVTAGTPR